MYKLTSLRDPLGNSIQFPSSLPVSAQSFAAITQAITTPAFLIRGKNNRRLYFFRLISVDINLLVEAHFAGKDFMVKSCVENPSAEYISSLLAKGALFSF